MRVTTPLKSLAVFSAKLILFYVITLIMLAPSLDVGKFVRSAKAEAKGWAVESLSARGFVYRSLVINKDPQAAAEVAKYLELIGEYKASIAAWGAAAEILQYQTQPVTDKTIKSNVDRISTRDAGKS